MSKKTERKYILSCTLFVCYPSAKGIFGKGQTQLTLKIWIIFSFHKLYAKEHAEGNQQANILLFFFTQETVWLSKTSAFTYYGNVGWHAFVRQATEECKVMTPTVLTSWNTAVYILINYLTLMCLIRVELLIISYEQNSEHDAQWAYLKSRTWKVSRLKAAPDSPRANFQKNE